MKTLLGISLGCLLASNVVAQRGGGFRGGFGGFRGGVSRFGRNSGVRFIGNRPLRSDGLLNYGWGYPAYYGDYGMPTADSGQSAPSTIILLPMLSPTPEPPPPPPPPVRSVIREYYWPKTDQEESAAEFAIVTNDNAVHHASMIWVDGGTLYFHNKNGGGQLSRASISRDLTYQANPGKNLKAWLP